MRNSLYYTYTKIDAVLILKVTNPIQIILIAKLYIILLSKSDRRFDRKKDTAYYLRDSFRRIHFSINVTLFNEERVLLLRIVTKIIDIGFLVFC
jgi:hypothetical protein